MHLNGKCIFALGAIVLVCAVAGCGRTTATVNGTVTYKNQPLDYGTVVFFVKGKQPILAQIETTGTFSAKNLPYGEAKIEVHSRRAQQGVVPKHNKGSLKEIAAPEVLGVVIPEMYNDKETSGLILTIDRKVLEFNIELKDPS